MTADREPLDRARGWRRPVAATLLVLLVGGYLAWRVAGLVGPPAAPRDCRDRLEVLTPDARGWDASAWRCRRPVGPGPAILAWGRNPGATEAWIARLADGWPWRGHEAWSIDVVPPPEGETARAVLAAALEAMGDEWAVDPGRMGVVLEGPAAAAWPVPGVAATVLVDPPPGLTLPDPPPGDLLVIRTGPLRWRAWTGEAAREADTFLRERLIPRPAPGP